MIEALGAAKFNNQNDYLPGVKWAWTMDQNRWQEDWGNLRRPEAKRRITEAKVEFLSGTEGKIRAVVNKLKKRFTAFEVVANISRVTDRRELEA